MRVGDRAEYSVTESVAVRTACWRYLLPAPATAEEQQQQQQPPTLQLEGPGATDHCVRVPLADAPPQREAVCPPRGAREGDTDVFTQIRFRVRKEKYPVHNTAASSRGDAAAAAAATAPPAFTREQVQVLQLVLDGASVFIGGKAGTGKSFLLREIAHRLRDGFGLRVAVTASTGVAALNIDGNTFHSTFGVPVYHSDGEKGPGLGSGSGTRRCRRRLHHHRPTSASVTLCGAAGRGRLLAGPQRGRPRTGRVAVDTETLAHTDAIIVDEVSLLHAGYLEALERAGRKAAGKNPLKPFGGIQVILSGDFMQLTPFRGNDQGPRGCSHRGDRKVCTGVKRPTKEAAAYGDGDVDGAGGSSPAGKRVLTGWERRYSVGHYVDLPLYKSYVFQRALLHVQLTHVVRQDRDAVFVRELNQLRMGELPYRLSRCAVLNKPDPNAIRLFAVKSAVRAFNQEKMLELRGEEQPFRSQVQLQAVSGCSERRSRDRHCDAHETESSLTKPGQASSKPFRKTAPHQCRPPTKQFSSDTALLHFSRWRAGRSRGLYGGRPMAQDEANAVVSDLCAAVGCSRGEEVTSFAMPFPFSRCLPMVSTVAVRCFGRSKSEAAGKLERLLMCAQEKMHAHPQLRPCGGPDSSMPTGRVSGKPSSRPPPGVFPSCTQWCLVRCESYSTQRFIALLQPSMQQRFLQSIQRDVALQDKVLKVGCRVMLLRNMNTKYVNGSLGTVIAFRPLSACASLLPRDLKVLLPASHHVMMMQNTVATSPRDTKKKKPPCRDDSGVKLPVVRMDVDGCAVAIPWVVLPLPPAAHEGLFTGRVVSMPLTPAYAFTVHKIQGVTLDHPTLFDGKGMFPCDHLLYVAASRVRAFSQLRWVNVSPQMISVHKPSLLFSESLPSVEAAQRVWEAWKRTPLKADWTLKCADKSQLFFPSWRCGGGAKT